VTDLYTIVEDEAGQAIRRPLEGIPVHPEGSAAR
jgi:hypothetical protein